MTYKLGEDLIRSFEKVIKKPQPKAGSEYFTGVDLGTACIVLAVLDETGQPVAGALRYADIVRDGMLVDYMGAVDLVSEMKEELERKLNTELIYAATAIPPGTENVDGGAVKNVVESAGFILTKTLDEPTAANAVLKLENGAVVDIGGGTTGIAIFKDGKLLATMDEATGGRHFSLVLAGAMDIDYEQAEEMKRNSKEHRKIRPILSPVVDKVSSIISDAIEPYDVEQIVLVGGSSILEGIEEQVQANTGIPTDKPVNPMFVTPLGIALQGKHGKD